MASFQGSEFGKLMYRLKVFSKEKKPVLNEPATKKLEPPARAPESTAAEVPAEKKSNSCVCSLV